MGCVPWTSELAAFPAAVALTALVLLFVGRRGRRVNDHPICRRCGFDLTGRPAASTVCSECGADLRPRRSVRIGARVRRRGLIALALLLLVPSVACLAFLGWSGAGDVPMVQRKPLWWLLNDAAGKDPLARDAAFNEIFLRLRAGRLTDAQVDDVTGRALALQADPKKVWLPQWGDFVEEAYLGGKVPAERWRSYVRQAPQFELVATERFGRRDRAWLELVERPSRVGSSTELNLRVHRRLFITDGEGRSFERDFGWTRCGVGGRSRLQGGWSLPLNDGVIGRLSDGRHQARLEVVVEVCPAGEAGSRASDRPPVATNYLSLRAAWNVQPRFAPHSEMAVTRK
jgi:hypothetical protein